MIEITKGSSSIETIKVTQHFSIEICKNLLTKNYWTYDLRIRLLDHEDYDEEALMVYASNSDNELEVLQELIDGLTELRESIIEKQHSVS